MTGYLIQDTSKAFRRKMRKGALLSPAGWRAVAIFIAWASVLFFGIRMAVTP